MKVTLNLAIQDNIIVFADQKRIEQVLYNLINNAFNHTPSDGTITINAFVENDSAKISISDTGVGIPKDKLVNIWDRFYKASDENIRNIPTTGLGLAIVKTILQAHNSMYGVESIEGSGTTFWFYLRKNFIIP
jgi:signal transduction histidine kinase